MSVLAVSPKAQGEDTPSISKREGTTEIPAFYLEVQKGLLSVEIHNAPLEDVLMAIAQQNGFRRLKVQGNAALTDKTSIRFQSLPLDQGIRRILRGRSYSLTYAQTKRDREKGSPATLEEVRIFGEGNYEQSSELNLLEGKGSVPPMSLKGSIQQALYGKDAALRQALLEGDMCESAPRAMMHLEGDVMMGSLPNTIADKDFDAGETGFVALAEVGGFRVRELIRKGLEHENKEVRKVMAGLFGGLHGNYEM